MVLCSPVSRGSPARREDNESYSRWTADLHGVSSLGISWSRESFFPDFFNMGSCSSNKSKCETDQKFKKKEKKKFSKQGFNSTRTVNFQMFKVDLEKAEEQEIKLPTSAGSSRKQESSRKKINSCFIDCAKAFDCVDHNKLWKILQEMGIPHP